MRCLRKALPRNGKSQPFLSPNIPNPPYKYHPLPTCFLRPPRIRRGKGGFSVTILISFLRYLPKPSVIVVMDMKKISCFILVAALSVSAALAAHEEAAHEEKKLAPAAASTPEATGAGAPEAATAGPTSDGAAGSGPVAAGGPGPSASGANAVTPFFGLIGASLVSLVAFYLR
ncbi:hypothetical protein ACLOJK_015038 [Asimina triloba]